MDTNQALMQKLTTDQTLSEEALTESFRRNQNHSLRTLLELYRGQYLRLILAVLLFAVENAVLCKCFPKRHDILCIPDGDCNINNRFRFNCLYCCTSNVTDSFNRITGQKISDRGFYLIAVFVPLIIIQVMYDHPHNSSLLAPAVNISSRTISTGAM